MTELLDLLHTVLRSPPDDGPGELVFAARGAHYTLPYLTLSAIEDAGSPLGPASGDELRRARRRHEIFLDVERRLGFAQGARPLKGSVLQGLYPPGVLRGRGDVDLLVPMPAIWAAAREVVSAYPVEHIEITLVDGLRDAVIAMYWPGDDYLNDPPVRVELCSAAFLGDFGPVPIRREPPDDSVVASMCLLAEELLQRRRHARDLVDVFVVDRSGQLDADALADQAVELHLAPELLELLTAATEFYDLRATAPLLTVLPPAASAERARREAADARAPQLRFAYPLPDGVSVRDESVLLSGDRGESVLLSPIGAYLMVESGTVPADVLERGQAILEKWQAASAL